MSGLCSVSSHKTRRSAKEATGRQAGYFIEDMMEMLSSARPGCQHLAPDIQHGLAGLVWQTPSRRREHSRYPGAAFFTHQELDRKFGRGQFLALNRQLDLFEVLDYGKGRYTRGYRLKPDIQKAQQSVLKHIRTNLPIVRLLYEDGHYMRSVPNAVASKDMSGHTATKWTGASRMMSTPVDGERLILLLQWLERQIAANTDDLFSAVDVESLRYMEEVAGKILALASTDVAGQGFVMQQYVESDSGRLYALNVNLQNAPRLIKQSALHGLWEYDLRNCHYAIFDQMAQRAGYEAKNIKRYLASTSATRLGIAQRVDITLEQAKVCLLAIMYGAKANLFPENAIPEAIGEDAARCLFKDPVFLNLHADIKQGRKVILASQLASRGAIFNAVGKFIRIDEGVPQRLAHLIQGVEASMLKVVVELYGEDIVLLQHDGFASRTQLDVAFLEQVIHQRTGYRMRLEGNQIAIPPDLNKTKL